MKVYKNSIEFEIGYNLQITCFCQIYFRLRASHLSQTTIYFPTCTKINRANAESRSITDLELVLFPKLLTVVTLHFLFSAYYRSTCEHNELDIDCGSQLIYITSAMYGIPGGGYSSCSSYVPVHRSCAYYSGPLQVTFDVIKVHFFIKIGLQHVQQAIL